MGTRLTPEDDRVRQVLDMRKRGLTQVEMARATGASQSTISRVVRYLDTLASDQLAALAREREPNSLRAMIRRARERKALRDQLYAAFHADCNGCTGMHEPCQPEKVAQLQERINALQ